MMPQGKDILHLHGWQVGFNKVEFTKLMKEEVGLSLSDAKRITDRLLAGETVIVEVHNQMKVANQARELGAIVLDSRSTDAN